MVGRLFLHIGPPKTATTGLQYAFEAVADETLIYGGTFQPRDRNSGSLSDILARAAKESSTRRDRPLQGALTGIREEIGAGRTVIISEEMLVVSDTVPVAERLAFLGECLAGVPTTVVLCARDPQEAIPSFYQEAYSSLPFLTKLSFARFCRSDMIDCYDYRKIVNLLQEAGFDTIRIMDFEQLCSGPLTLRDLFDCPDLPDTRLSLRKVNTSRIKDNPTVRKLEPISLKIIGQTRLFRKLRKLPVFGDDQVAGGLAAIAGLIRIPNSEYRRLSIPEAQVQYFVASYQFARRLQARSVRPTTAAGPRDAPGSPPSPMP